MVDAEVVYHHIGREHHHNHLIDGYGNILQMDLCIVKDNEQEHEQKSGGNDHDEVAFEPGIQFSPENLAKDKCSICRLVCLFKVLGALICKLSLYSSRHLPYTFVERQIMEGFR
jgi:hypothetical protein